MGLPMTITVLSHEHFHTLSSLRDPLRLKPRILGAQSAVVGSGVIATNKCAPGGAVVQIDIFETDTQSHIKEKLEGVTGIPAEHQKLRFGGINQLYVSDTRTNIKVGSCGTASGEYEVQSMVLLFVCPPLTVVQQLLLCRFALGKPSKQSMLLVSSRRYAVHSRDSLQH